MLIEDNSRHVQLFQEALGEAGVAVAGAPPYELDCAETLAGGLERLATASVDVVLLDVTLPDAEGLEALIELRERFPDVPVIVLTPLGDDVLPSQALQAGAQDYLAKGQISGDLLSRVVRHAVEVNRLQNALRSLSFLDGLTGLYNRRGFVTLAEPHLKLTQRSKGTFLVVSVDVIGLAAINEAVGFEEADRVLREVAEILRRCFRDSDLLARLEGGTFITLAAEAAPDTPPILAERLRRQAQAYNDMTLRPYTLRFAVGFATGEGSSPAPIEDLMGRAGAARRPAGG